MGTHLDDTKNIMLQALLEKRPLEEAIFHLQKWELKAILPLGVILLNPPYYLRL
jgi:hypothetical protein